MADTLRFAMDDLLDCHDAFVFRGAGDPDEYNAKRDNFYAAQREYLRTLRKFADKVAEVSGGRQLELHELIDIEPSFEDWTKEEP